MSRLKLLFFLFTFLVIGCKPQVSVENQTNLAASSYSKDSFTIYAVLEDGLVKTTVESLPNFDYVSVDENNISEEDRQKIFEAVERFRPYSPENLQSARYLSQGEKNDLFASFPRKNANVAGPVVAGAVGGICYLGVLALLIDAHVKRPGPFTGFAGVGGTAICVSMGAVLIATPTP